jgi:serine O-acetyltransferase
MTPAEMSWQQTRSAMQADRQRLAQWFQWEGPFPLLHPSYVCACLYRLSHYFHCCGHKFLARFLWHLNSYLTGADLPPAASIGPGLVIAVPAGTTICGTVGRNLTVMSAAGIGGEVGRWNDVGAGPGLPLVGDDVLLEPHAGILGPVRIGNNARIGPGVAVVTNVPAGLHLIGPPARRFRDSFRR